MFKVTTSDADHTLTVQHENDGIQIDEVNTDQVNIVVTEENDTEADISNDLVHNAENTSRNFFVEKEAVLVQSKPKTNTRRYLSKVVSGKAITEKETVDKIIEHKNRGKTPQKKSVSIGKQKEKVPNKSSSNKPFKGVKTGKKPKSKSARKSNQKLKAVFLKTLQERQALISLEALFLLIQILILTLLKMMSLVVCVN